MSSETSFEEFKRRAKQGNLVPVSKELAADLETPVSVFLKLAYGKPHAFLLESVELGEKIGRFSLVGMDPDVILEWVDHRCVLTQGRRKKYGLDGDLLRNAQVVMSWYRYAPDPALPSLIGGLFGYIGYELIQQFEEVRLREKPGLQVPDSVLLFPRSLVLFDHLQHRLKLIQLASIEGSVRQSYERSLMELKRMEHKLARPLPAKHSFPKQEGGNIRLRSNMTRRKFESIVGKAKTYIRAGDCIQVVLSQRFDLGPVTDDFTLYRSLRSINPSPYMFYFRHNDLSLVGSSPEMLAKKTRRTAEIRPIAGTRPRGASDEEDLAYESALRDSKKEAAEHVMLVDLGRNDLGRVSKPRTVRVNDFARVERYSHVMHLVSEIKSVLKTGKNAFDLLRASFPAGTVTGAPKIRAIQIIDELEEERRGPYAGSLGYFSLSGDMDMCITIRTILVYRNRACVQAGAGIVNDSIPQKEYFETINKAKALLRAVERSREKAAS